MSCLSRIFGLLFALVLGLGLLLLSLALVGRWNELGVARGALYSLLCAITGAVCLFLGGAILFGRNRSQTPNLSAPGTVAPVVAAPVVLQSAPNVDSGAAPTFGAPIIEAPKPETPLDSPELRIYQLGRARPGWRGNAPQLAQLTNLSLGVAEATARSMAHSGEGVQIATGESGEAIFVLNSQADPSAQSH